MAHHNTVFVQLLRFLPRHEFDAEARQHQRGQGLRVMSRWAQFVALGLAQLTGRQSLRDIVSNLSTQGRKLYHLSRLRNSWGWRLGAVLNSPGKHPFALDRRLDAGSGGPAARREVEVGLFRRVADRASEHRWVTDAGRAPRGVAGGALVMSPGVRAGRR